MAKKRTVKNRKKRLLAILGAVVLFVVVVLGVLQLGVVYTENSWDNWKPDYEKADIGGLLKKAELTEADYETLYAQTGLTRLGIDGLLAAGKRDRILAIQEHYFADHEAEARHFAPFTYQEEVNANAAFAIVEDGDVIVSASVRVSWFRYGHAALVVDGANERILEAISPGCESEMNYVSAFQSFSNFIILRPKVEKETKAEIARYARENMVDIPYRLTEGVLSKKYAPEGLTGTQCAHLVWYAYKRFGYDLDSTGGAVVKPRDMAQSPLMEVVQVYGFDPDTLWS
ncbi:MAG: hypothetical protein IJX91_00175 [Clostridia bacterium]|nr:hypothetical protein [Clostridia bacterium]